MTTSSHPRHALDPVIHMPIRLSIMACLAGVSEAEFSFVMETVEINAPTCSKQITTLQEAGYVAVRKGSIGRRPRTWLSLTRAGRAALTTYLATVYAIAGTALPDPTDTTTDTAPEATGSGTAAFAGSCFLDGRSDA